MLMFRFWGSERGSEQTVETCDPMSYYVEPQNPPLSSTIATNCVATSLTGAETAQNKKRRQSFDESPASQTAPDGAPSAKRARNELPCDIVTPPSEADMFDAPATNDLDSAREAIQYQFGLEILLKHDELRLINQELAKCQVALEQLRRCHLIPYPINCPTPDQMVEISNGTGPALKGRPGEMVPQWAPPFGVVDGPYARHYAKWLIPDPKFDGMQPEWQPVLDAGRSRSSVEGRTTRNSIVDLGSTTKSRAGRGLSGQRLHALSSGYPQPKEKAGPCVLKRSDGQTVKLVCIDCQRENFSSTQGFINHCRIAHRRDFKSHEEAAVHSGHPIEPNEGAATVGEEKASSNPSLPASGLVHPFAQVDISTQQAYVALRSRIADSLKLYHQGKLPGVTSIPSAPKHSSLQPENQKAAGFVSAPDAPFLSRLMQSRKFSGNLSDIVSDAKQKVDFDDLSPGDDSDDNDHVVDCPDGSKGSSVAPRAPVIMRVPARTAMSPAPIAVATKPTSSKGRSPNMGFASPPMSIPDKDEEQRDVMIHDVDVDMDVDLSPNTLVSNNAPSLVSDDGEYDDSDDGSSDSGGSDSMDAESVSDVAEINLEEDHEPRSIRHHREVGGVGSGTAMRLKKEESKHVTFVSPVKNNGKRTRKV